MGQSRLAATKVIASINARRTIVALSIYSSSVAVDNEIRHLGTSGDRSRRRDARIIVQSVIGNNLLFSDNNDAANSSSRVRLAIWAGLRRSEEEVCCRACTSTASGSGWSKNPL